MHDAIDVPAGGHEGGIEELFFGARARHWHLHNLMDAAGVAHRIHLAGDEGVHRRHVIEPLEIDLHAGFLEPAFLDADLPSDPAGPIGVGDFERGGGERSGGYECCREDFRELFHGVD